ncbi:m-AAA protease-interacting protein 1, mitochondrial [Trichonephila clavipes]|nr:m-AAA protease-interacting protein 1, mitochondrial [Trichonephila clavipes]
MLQQRNLNTSSNDDDGKNRNPKQSVSLMDFNPVMRPDIWLSIKNWILAKFIIQPYLDNDFTLTDFTMGAKQALGIVSSYLSQGDFQSLRGLLTEDAIAEIRRNFSKLNVKERQDLFIKISDIFIVFPYEIGIIFDDDSQKRFAEITVVYHIIKDFEEMRAHGRVNSETVKEDIKICNYSRPSSFHTLPKLFWWGSWRCNLGQSLSNHRPHVFYRQKIRRASRPGKQLNLVIDEEPLDKVCHVWSHIILLKYGCGHALKVRKDNWLQHLGDVALAV